MATTTFELNTSLFDGIRRFKARITARGLWSGLILLAALVAFELFNFATTEYALQSLFGSQDALGIATWAKILAIAFCGIDFAGLSRLFTPETGHKEPREVWLLTGAWFLGAGMNAVMTWWAVGSALSANPYLGNELVSRADILRIGPIFIAGLVWFTRILIIGTFAFAGDHLFSTAQRTASVIDSRATPLSAMPPATPRSVPKPSTRSLPERGGMPLASSAYARHDETGGTPARYSTQRELFGRGAGSMGESYGAASARFQPVGSSMPATNPGQGFAASSTPPRPEPAPAQPEPEATQPLKWATPRTQGTRQPEPLRRPSAFDGPSRRSAVNNRASSTRVVEPAPTSFAREGASATTTEPDDMELEYVDLD
ncbi:MAG: hypothetical protein Kow0077_11860 [Anaerolineae bacterium]